MFPFANQNIVVVEGHRRELLHHFVALFSRKCAEERVGRGEVAEETLAGEVLQRLGHA